MPRLTPQNLTHNTPMQLHPYTASHAAAWDHLVAHSRNGTFLLQRPFMDYHADRFRDASLLFYHKEQPIGLLPASRHDDEIISHGGLTYGGFILAPSAHATDLDEMLQKAMRHYLTEGCKRLTIKPIPHIYHTQACEEELYWLFRHGATLTARSLSTAIRLDAPLPFSTLRRRKVQTALRQGVRIVEAQWEEHAWWTSFYATLDTVLSSRHACRPVHTLDELGLLRSRFPEAIRLFVALNAHDEVLAGTLLFITPQVIHAQYIASSEAGRECGALDLLFHHLVDHWQGHAAWFDFGISTESAGHYLNEGLNFQKEGFGGRSIVYDTYSLEL